MFSSFWWSTNSLSIWLLLLLSTISTVFQTFLVSTFDTFTFSTPKNDWNLQTQVGSCNTEIKLFIIIFWILCFFSRLNYRQRYKLRLYLHCEWFVQLGGMMHWARLGKISLFVIQCGSWKMYGPVLSSLPQAGGACNAVMKNYFEFQFYFCFNVRF